MSAPTIGYSPWDLYGPCDCGADAGAPCRTGATGAARLVVHYSRRPVDDVTGAGFTSVLTRDERQLLARIHRWARTTVAGSYWPRWERGLLPGMWQRTVLNSNAERAEVAWGPANDGRMTVEVQDGRYGEKVLNETVTPRGVREAVDLLVVWGILPVEFSSLYTAPKIFTRAGGGVAGPSGAVGPTTAPPDGPLPRLVHPAPITDPALRGRS